MSSNDSETWDRCKQCNKQVADYDFDPSTELCTACTPPCSYYAIDEEYRQPGCNCHPDYYSVVVEESDLGALAKEIARQEEAGHVAIDLQDVRYSRELSWSEQNALRSALEREHEALRSIRAQEQAARDLKVERDRKMGTIPALQKSLDGLRAELTHEAIEIREQQIATLKAELP